MPKPKPNLDPNPNPDPLTLSMDSPPSMQPARVFSARPSFVRRFFSSSSSRAAAQLGSDLGAARRPAAVVATLAACPTGSAARASRALACALTPECARRGGEHRRGHVLGRQALSNPESLCRSRSRSLSLTLALTLTLTPTLTLTRNP